ncbi:MAG: AzlC family ABC transporter permease [Clostridia bacterium]|nr:AzlC family ABC transporter permease [Clostridia bacterium]
MRDGIPIGLGYLAVSFSLGIVAQKAGLGAIESLIASFLCNASAGEYAGFALILAGGTYLEMAIITLVANARYFLMSCALSQKADDMPLIHRCLVSFGLTDEIFGISVAREGILNPYYSYGAFLIASPCWAVGTALGAVAGNVLPLRVVSALSVALYGMFFAIFIPPAKEEKSILGIVSACFILSFLCSVVPVISGISEGVRIIILTVVISSLAALIFPKDDDEEEAK